MSKPFIGVVVGIIRGQLESLEIEEDDLEGVIELSYDQLKDGIAPFTLKGQTLKLFRSGSPFQHRPDDIVGLIVNELDEIYFPRALMCLVANESRNIALPLDNPEEFRRVNRREKFFDMDQVIREHRNLINFGGLGLYETDRWWEFAKLLLQQVGYPQVKREDLRAYLIFDWS